MNGSAARLFRLGMGLCALVAVGWVLTGQAARPANHAAMSVPTDWSHTHLIFSRPATPEMAARVSEDPRYWQQIARREITRTLIPQTPELAESAALTQENPKTTQLQRDWAENMGTGANIGAGNYIARFTASATTANCAGASLPDYVVYSTGLPGTAGSQADIVAFDNLYSGGCSGTVPETFWAYNTTDADGANVVKTSPVPSLDGSQIAFVQTNGSLHQASVVLLKWAANDGTIGSPHTLTSISAASYTTCVAPCMTTIALTDSHGTQTDDVTSSIFYDYGNDTAWVGDSLGTLHKFHPFFKGTHTTPPAEIRSAPWPVTVIVGNDALTSAIFDSVSGNLFMEGADGFLYSVNNGTGTVTKSKIQLDHGTGGVFGPVVDTVGQRVYVFSSSDGTTNCTLGACAAVFQLPTTFTSATNPSKVTVGSSNGTPTPLYIGAFDNAYFNSPNRTGALYVCGNHSGPTLYQVPITAGAFPGSGLGTLVTNLTGTSTAGCSPVTDIPNPNDSLGPIERVFVSTQNNGLNGACANAGCIYTFVNTPWRAKTGFAVGQQILSSNLDVEVVLQAGTSGTKNPNWIAAGSMVDDGGVIWIDQGRQTSHTMNGWVKNSTFTPVTDRILDPNGNIEVPTTPGISGGTIPTFMPNVGQTTHDNTITWTNAGHWSSTALPAAGGTSGILADNVVAFGVLSGASQVYFSTLSNQRCTTSGTNGGCAVQASQSALK